MIATGSAAPRLRLFDSSDDSHPQFWTLRQAFEEKKLPALKRLQRASGTIAKWHKAIWYWEHVTENPPISLITDDVLQSFLDSLLSPERQLAIRTHKAANQQLMYVQGILRGCRQELDYRVPAAIPLPHEAPTRIRRIVNTETLEAIYRHCSIARLSYDARIPAPLLMRAALVLFLTAGCRRCEGWLMPSASYVRQPEFPQVPEYTDCELDAESPLGWLVFHTPKTKVRKGCRPLVIPVNSALKSHLDELDRLAPRRQRLLPLGDHPSTWKKQFDRIQRAAGIEDPYCWQDLRKTASRLYRRVAGREVAKFILGQQPRGVNATYYDDLTQDGVEACEKIELPACFHFRGD